MTKENWSIALNNEATEETEDKKSEEAKTDDIEALPFPLDEEVSVPFKPGKDVFETIANIRQYQDEHLEKKHEAANDATKEPEVNESEKTEDPAETSDDQSDAPAENIPIPKEEDLDERERIRREFEDALSKEQEINRTLQERICDLTTLIDSMKGKEFTKEEFNKDAIFVLKSVKKALLYEMNQTDPDAARKLMPTVRAIFAALIAVPRKMEGEVDE